MCKLAAPFFSLWFWLALPGLCETPETEYFAAMYNVSLYDSCRKDCGIKNLSFNGGRLIVSNILYSNVETGAMRTTLKELPGDKYSVTRQGDILEMSFTKYAAPQRAPDDITAKVDRAVVFKPSGIDVNVTFTAEKEITYSQYSSCLCLDNLSFLTAPITGRTVEARKDGLLDMGLLETKYDKDRWGVNGFYKEVNFIGGKDCVSVRAGANCEIRFVYYGSGGFEIHASYMRDNSVRRAMTLRKGEKLAFNYSVVFEKH
jgi:hypothetical protein